MTRSMRFLLTAALLSAGLIAARPGSAGTVAVVELTGTPTPTDVSGYKGSTFTLGDADSSDRALVAVLSRERSDKPCEVSVGWEDVNKSSINDAITKDLCGGNGATSSTMGGTYANTGGTANRVFLTGVQVCMNKDDDRIKGIHLAGYRITETGTLAKFSPDAQDSRTNCHQDHWKRWVNCPAGQIATAAVIHFAAGGTPRSWTGIELRCRTVHATSATTTATTEPSTLGDVTGANDKGLAETIDCNDTEALDLRAVAWNIADDWSNFSKAIETATGDNLGSCLADRFAKNGKVQCVHQYDCKKPDTDGTQKCRLGHAFGLDRKMKIFQTFFDNIGSLNQADRRACYAALMTHEFSHTCEHYKEKGPEARAVAAFDYWKGRFDVSSTLTSTSDTFGCGMND